MNCSRCNQPILSHIRICPVCQLDVGFPNVRATQTTEEIEALARRVKEAQISAQLHNCETELNDFGQAVLQSKAVIACNFNKLYRFINSDNELYNTFYQQVDSESRLPEDNHWDHGRPSIDATLFPHYEKNIVFAALSLDNHGLEYYGEYTVVLREETIESRATVFDENSINFCQKHRIVAGSRIPPGYRASWSERDKLAMAKLHGKIDNNTRPDDYPGILMTPKGNSPDDDFIEVHIYGAIHRRAIECVAGTEPKNQYDRVNWKSIKKKLKEINACLEES
jgi:hypothetical protein